jgi:hypothetical protein
MYYYVLVLCDRSLVAVFLCMSCGGSRVYDINTKETSLPTHIDMDVLSGDRCGNRCSRLQEQKKHSDAEQRKDSCESRALLRDGGVRDQLNEERHRNPSRYVQKKRQEFDDGTPSSLRMKCAHLTNPTVFTGVRKNGRAIDQTWSGHQQHAQQEHNADELMCSESATLCALSQLHGDRVTHRECEIGTQSSQSVSRTTHVLTELELRRIAHAYQFRPPSDTHTFHSLGIGLFISESPNSSKTTQLSKSYVSNVPVSAPCTYGCAFLIMIRVLMSHGCTLKQAVGSFEGILSTAHQELFDKLSPHSKSQRRRSMFGLTIHSTQFRLLSGIAFREKYNTIRRAYPSHVRRAFSVTASISLWFGAMWLHEPNKCKTKALVDVINECVFDMSATCDYGQLHPCEQLEFDSLRRAQQGLTHPTLQLYTHTSQFASMLTLVRNLFWNHESSVEDLIQTAMNGDSLSNPSIVRLGSQIQMLAAKRKQPEWQHYEYTSKRPKDSLQIREE